MADDRSLTWGELKQLLAVAPDDSEIIMVIHHGPMVAVRFAQAREEGLIILSGKIVGEDS